MDDDQLARFDPSALEALRRRLEETGNAVTPAIQRIIEIANRPVIAPEVLEKLRTVATSPVVEAMREATARMDEHMARIKESLLEGGLASVPTVTSGLSEIKVPKTTQHYILEAQYDTVEVIHEMGSLLEESLEVQGKQIEVLEAVQKSADQQTGLTRWVLGFAIAAVGVGLAGIATMVAIALLG
jgi:hypothetical protein